MKFLALTLLIGSCLAAASTASANRTVKVIRLTAVQQSQTQSKTGFVIRDNDFSGKKRVGHDTLTCTVISKLKANCKLLITLARRHTEGNSPDSLL